MSQRDTIIPIADVRTLRIPALKATAKATTDSRMLADTRGRQIRDLRISVTDRCNFRCTYCMPKEVFDANYEFLPHDELLTFEEIVRVAKVAHGLGVEKIRLTGGEPLLRKGIERLIAMLVEALPGIDIALTTNGSALKAKARALKAAGLQRITFSLDSLNEKTWQQSPYNENSSKTRLLVDHSAVFGDCRIMRWPHSHSDSWSATRRSILSAYSYQHLSHRPRGLPRSDDRQPLRSEQSVSPDFPRRRPLLESGRQD